MIARASGRVVATHAHAVEALLPGASLGDAVRIITSAGVIGGRVVTLAGGRVQLIPHGEVRGVAAGDRVEIDLEGQVAVGVTLLGRAIDAAGNALDGRERARRAASSRVNLQPADRRAVSEPFWSGVRAIDALLTFGHGARIGIFGAPGAGKSTLLEQIARFAQCDAVVVGLTGERGREAERWIRTCDARTTIVCATSDRPAAERVAAAELAFRQAEALRAHGLAVLLILDSLARTAAAWRESALALGELPARGGYPPSVFAQMARLVERAGPTRRGSVTLIATVLTDGADEREPLSEAARSLLDGHLVLDQALVHAGRFPAIDVLGSASRTMESVVSSEQRTAARRVRGALALLAGSRELREAGLWAPGREAGLDRAVAAEPRLEAFRFGPGPTAEPQSLDELLALADML